MLFIVCVVAAAATRILSHDRDACAALEAALAGVAASPTTLHLVNAHHDFMHTVARHLAATTRQPTLAVNCRSRALGYGEPTRVHGADCIGRTFERIALRVGEAWPSDANRTLALHVGDFIATYRGECALPSDTTLASLVWLGACGLVAAVTLFGRRQRT